MTIYIADNIRKIRKEHSMTQEQLAEALDVSIGAVSKWERGLANPDLDYIVQIADLFEISIDSLFGYDVQSGTCAALEKRIHDLQKAKRYDLAEEEAEKALVRYPNNFKIIYRCSEMFQLKGMETGDRKSVKRAIELWERARLLLSQNTDERINEFTIQAEIAQCYIVLGQVEKGIELLKKCNVGGIHNAVIGMIYTEHENLDSEKALPFLTESFLQGTMTLFRVVEGYVNYYMQNKKYEAALDAAVWLLNFMDSVKEREEVCFIDKFLARICANCSIFSKELGRQKDADEYERKAYEYAGDFDQSPGYTIENIKFCTVMLEDMTIYEDTTADDGVILTAREMVKRIINEERVNETLE